jgi:hypothetical protein
MSPQTHKVGNSHKGPRGFCLTPNLLEFVGPEPPWQ